MANKKQEASDRMGEILRVLLEDSGIYPTRREWANRLQVDESLISRWISKNALIQPEELESILSIVERDGTSPRAAKTLQQFWAAADLAPSELAPNRGLRCSLGEWVAKASKNLLLATFENRDGYRQRLIAQLAIKLELLGTKCDYELGEERTRHLFGDIFQYYVAKMSELSAIDVQKRVALLQKEQRPHGKAKASGHHTIGQPRDIPDALLWDPRRRLVRGADVEAAMESFEQPTSGVRKLVPRSGPFSKTRETALALHSIGNANLQWHIITAGALASDIMDGDEAIVVVQSGDLSITIDGHPDFICNLTPCCIARLSRGPDLRPYVFKAITTTKFLLVSVKNSAALQSTRDRKSRAPRAKTSLLQADRIDELNYTYKAARFAEVHAAAYKRRDIGRFVPPNLRSKGALIDLQIIKVSSAKDDALLDRIVAYHFGYELIIPVKGTVGVLFGEMSKSAGELMYAELRRFKDPGRVVLRSANADFRIPDALAFSSFVPHTLYAAGGDHCAYAIHLRIFGPDDEVARDRRSTNVKDNVHVLPSAKSTSKINSRPA